MRTVRRFCSAAATCGNGDSVTISVEPPWHSGENGAGVTTGGIGAAGAAGDVPSPKTAPAINEIVRTPATAAPSLLT